MLNDSDLLQYLSFDKKSPAFFCPNCDEEKGEAYEFPKLAQLKGDLPTTTQLHCFFYQKSYEVVRRPCLDASCIHRVLVPDQHEDGAFLCLECHEETDPEEAEAGQLALSTREEDNGDLR